MLFTANSNGSNNQKWGAWLDKQVKSKDPEISGVAKNVMSNIKKLDEHLEKYDKNPHLEEAFQEVINAIEQLKQHVIRLHQVTGKRNDEALEVLSALRDTLSAITGLEKGQVDTFDKGALVKNYFVPEEELESPKMSMVR